MERSDLFLNLSQASVFKGHSSSSVLGKIDRLFILEWKSMLVLSMKNKKL